MPKQVNLKPPQKITRPAKRNKLVCPICKGNHHVTDCDRSLNGMIASALVKTTKPCQRCGEATLGGPFCVGCSIDRALERILHRATNQNR